MKKKKCRLLGLVLLLLVSVYAINQKQNVNMSQYSDLILDNVEALAQTEVINQSPFNISTGKCMKLNTVSCPASGM